MEEVIEGGGGQGAGGGLAEEETESRYYWLEMFWVTRSKMQPVNN